MTLARDNNIGIIVGENSTYSPSHYGEVLPFRLPNTNVVGSVCCKYFVRPDSQHVDDKTLAPDVVIDLSDKAKAWIDREINVRAHLKHTPSVAFWFCV